MGVINLSVNERGVWGGNKKYAMGYFTMSSSYATGGDTGFTPALLGMDVIENVDISPPPAINVNYNRANNTIQAYVFDYSESNDDYGKEVPNSVDLTVTAYSPSNIYFWATGF